MRHIYVLVYINTQQMVESTLGNYIVLTTRYYARIPHIRSAVRGDRAECVSAQRTQSNGPENQFRKRGVQTSLN